jgi:hypothetical protein
VGNPLLPNCVSIVKFVTINQNKMKKLVLVLGLVMGSMIASDAFAYGTVGNETSYTKTEKPKKDAKKKKSKGSCCTKDHSSCCKKKTTETTPSK